MAPPDLQELTLAIRTRYGPEDNLIKLSELLFYIDSIKELLEQLKKPKKPSPKAHVKTLQAPERGRADTTPKMGGLHTTEPIVDRSSTTEKNYAFGSSTESQIAQFTFTAEHSTP